jgi:hypothetical protein
MTRSDYIRFNRTQHEKSVLNYEHKNRSHGYIKTEQKYIENYLRKHGLPKRATTVVNYIKPLRGFHLDFTHSQFNDAALYSIEVEFTVHAY